METYQCSSVIFIFSTNNLSTTMTLQAGSTFLPYSLAILVYLQIQQLTCSHEPNINDGDDVAHLIWIPTIYHYSIHF